MNMEPEVLRIRFCQGVGAYQYHRGKYKIKFNREIFMIQYRWPLIIGGISAAIAVSMNALGAHAFMGLLASTGKTPLFNTALHMHEMHAIGLVLIGIALFYQPTNRFWFWSALFMFVGQLLFCGNLYLLSLQNGSPLPLLTPIGGFCLIVSWILMSLGAVFVSRNKY